MPAGNTSNPNGNLVKAGADKAIGQASGKDAVKAEIDRLRSRHSLYDLYIGEWNFYLAAYEGGPDFVNTENIFRHPREHEADWQERVKRAHYHNYCERLVDFFGDFIFAETIDRSGGSNADFYNQFNVNVNRKGDDIDAFMKTVETDVRIFGMVWVLTDSPKLDPDKVRSKYDEELLGVRPYFVLVRPNEIFDWVTDEFEKLLYVKRYQSVVTMDGNVRRVLERYTEWTADQIKITDIDVTDQQKPALIEHGLITNTLGEIPFDVVRYKRSKSSPFMGNSFLRDLAYNNREVLNLTSLEQEFLYKQCFQFLAIERDTSADLKDQSDGEWGTSNVIWYPKDGKPPSFVTPTAEPAKYIAEARMNCVNEMYKRAAQDVVNELFNGQKASGFSKSMSFSTTVPKIASSAETLENAEIALMQRVMKYMSKEWDGKVKYKDRYEITNLTDAITQLTMLFKDLQMPSETFVKEELKRFVHEYDGKLPPDVIEKVHKEIDTMDFPEWKDAQREAFVGKAAAVADEQLAADQTSQGGNASKNQPPKAATPTRATSTTSEIQAESTKTSSKSSVRK